jgi:CNT family concentrative nucleoside transporter
MFALWFLSELALAANEAGNYIPGETTVLNRVMSFVGLFVLVGLAWVISENRKKINWRPVIWGVGLQLLLGLVLLSPGVSDFFYYVVDGGVRRLLSFSEEGATFVFTSLEPHSITTGPVPELFAGRGKPTVVVGAVSPPMKTFAFWILPTIIFFSSLFSVFYYLGILQWVVRGLAWLMMKTLGTSGAESLSAAGNIFIGQTEAPLLVRPFIDKMTRSELMAVMTGGFATVAGGVMGAYVQFLHDIPNIAGHLVMASIMSAPAALAIAKVMVPETEESLTAGEVKITFEQTSTNIMEAAATGAADGMKLALNVAAMLIAIVGLVAMFDWAIGLVPITFCDGGGVEMGYTCLGGGQPLNLSMILGWVFMPIAVIMGVPLSEGLVVGQLLGEKIVLTEFIAYINLGEIIHGDVPKLSQRSAIIASYALCGFANFASIGIQLGGIGGIAPRRMGDLASLGLRAMFAGVLAACMTGAIAGIML